MKASLRILLLWAVLIQFTFAWGSIDWVEVKSRVVKTDPKLVEIIDRSFIVNPGGSGVRLGPHFGERQGERIAPYTFYAENRKTKEEVVLVIEESDDFEYTGRFKFTWERPQKTDQADQIDTEQHTTRPESKLEGGNKPQPEAGAVTDLVTSFSKSPDERFSIGLDGILGTGNQAHPEFDVHLARLYDRKAGKFVGRKVPLSTEGCHIDFTNKKIGKDSWEAFWHPMSKFVVLAVPVTASENEGPHLEYFYFQITEAGILPISLPDVASHVFRSFKSDEAISIGHIEPKGWIEKNRLRVNITGSHFDGGEAPDFSRNGVLKFDEDGNVTVDSIEKEEP
jgi:hypothetical protein